MSQSASQASIFYRDVESSNRLWTIKDSGGFPAPKNSSGKRVMPVWSSKSRVEKIIKNVPAYKGFEPFEIDLFKFFKDWLKGLKNNGFLVGINWSGKHVTGYDVSPENLIKWINHIRPSWEDEKQKPVTTKK
ncbi:DUF2750 domain-containing protein [Flavivirga algicola]|uniref:DUF2750 domain-containing protein n=1 Tax=Flavivirga algicola TaxID=2729136 RepID=A0ABX1RT17_9FLAO|nr:DUF2750 domain-containing protein [Flavivirga algicola]NMH86135.1 DUF2750 domain-containing protein [Flavivirga algicola]